MSHNLLKNFQNGEIKPEKAGKKKHPLNLRHKYRKGYVFNDSIDNIRTAVPHKTPHPQSVPPANQAQIRKSILIIQLMAENITILDEDKSRHIESTLESLAYLASLNNPKPSFPRRVRALAIEIWDLQREESPDVLEFDKDLLRQTIRAHSGHTLGLVLNYFSRALDSARARLLADAYKTLHSQDRKRIYGLLKEKGYVGLIRPVEIDSA